MKLAQNEEILYSCQFSESFLPFNAEVFTDYIVITSYRLILDSKSKKSMIRNEFPLQSIKGISGAYFERFSWSYVKIALLLIATCSLLFSLADVSFIPVSPFIQIDSNNEAGWGATSLALACFLISFLFKNKKGMVFELTIKHEPFGVQNVSKYSQNDAQLTTLIMKTCPNDYGLLEELGGIILDLQHGHTPLIKAKQNAT